MKSLTKAAAMLLFTALIGHAQQVSGWTSLEWDASSQTLSGYAETELDDYASTYYAPKIISQIFDQNNNEIANMSREGEVGDTSVEAGFSIQVTPNETYTMISAHYGIIGYINDPAGGQNYNTYEDYYLYSSFATSQDSSIIYEGDYEWFGPGPDTAERTQVARLGSTRSRAATTTSGTCGDTRDNLIGEYLTYNVDLTPLCSDFDTNQYDTYFTNAELTVKEDPAYGWSLLTDTMLSEADTWRSNYGAMTINSGYRNPYHNAHLPNGVKGAHNSRHMHGDALDIENPTGDLPGRQDLIAAFPTGSDAPDYIEPTNLACHLACVHGDWRAHSQTYAHTLIATNRFKFVPLLFSLFAENEHSALFSRNGRTE